MGKLVWSCLLVLALFSCGTGKLKSGELFLSPDSGNDKIYILSAFPQQADSSGLFLSALLVKHTDEDNRQLTTFVTTYNRSTHEVATIPFFTDSLMSLDSKRFPLILKSGTTVSLQPSFTFSLDRNSLELTVDDLKGRKTGQTLKFPKQQPFKSVATGTEFKLTAIKPLSVTLTKWNNEPQDQSNVMFLHTLDNGESLFQSQSANNYCWLDFSTSETASHSLFFQYDSLGKITPIYSTLPDDVLPSIRLDSLFPLKQRRILTKSTFSVRAVDVLLNDQLFGTGILYILKLIHAEIPIIF